MAGDYIDEYDTQVYYAHAVATAYINPNFLVAGDFGVYHVDENFGYEADGLRWGAMIEAKPEGSLLSYFARYQGGTLDWNDDDENNVEHIVQAGIRLNFGAVTLQDRDAAVGLLDLNPMYGANSARHF